MNRQWELKLGSTLGSTYGVPSEGESIVDPNWQQIEHELLLLNGGETNDNVMLTSLVGKGTLGIGGGDHGRYIVTYLPPEDRPDMAPLTLTDLSLTGPDVPLTIQTTGEFPARYAVKLPLVLKVVEHFFRMGELLKSVRWEISTTGKEANL